MAVVGAIFLIIGCQESVPTEISEGHVGSPAFSADQNWVRDQLYVDNWVFVPCLGEDAHFYGWAPYQWHQVTSNSGNYSYHLQFRPVTPNSPPFYLETESRLYEYKNGGPVHETFHLAAGEVYNLVGRETYIATDSKDRLRVKYKLHITVNANGDLSVYKIDYFEAVCVEK
jgi:hypothetical protein